MNIRNKSHKIVEISLGNGLTHKEKVLGIEKVIEEIYQAGKYVGFDYHRNLIIQKLTESDNPFSSKA